MAADGKDKSLTVERILGAAHEEFAGKGFGGASIERIAREAGVTKQLVYHYFGSKDQLYRLTLESTAMGMKALLDSDAHHELSAVNTLVLVANRIMDEYIRNPSYAGLTLDQWLHHGAHITDASPYIPNTREVIAGLIQPILERGIAAGELRPGLRAEIVFWMLFHLASGCFHNPDVMLQTTDIDFRSEEGIATWRDAISDFIRHALVAPERSSY